MRNKTILITGATGTLGKALTKHLITLEPHKIIVYSRDEHKQKAMAKEFNYDTRIQYILGDVRMQDRLERVIREEGNVDVVIHTAAYKNVDKGEYNPDEFFDVNCLGARAVINAAGRHKVEKILAISTDKAVEPINTYGVSKAMSDRLFISANAMYPFSKFSLVRYGNVMGSNGSVVQIWQNLVKQRKAPPFPVTDMDMTRFWMNVKGAVGLVMLGLEKMVGGEVFVAFMDSFAVRDLASAWCDSLERFRDFGLIGRQPGEKLHEVVITEYDIAYKTDKCYIIYPAYEWHQMEKKGRDVSGLRYSSDQNDDWLEVDELEKRIAEWG